MGSLAVLCVRTAVGFGPDVDRCSPGCRLRILLVSSHGSRYLFLYSHFRPLGRKSSISLCVLSLSLCLSLSLSLSEVNLFWAAHQTHHSSEDYTLSTALRQSTCQVFTSMVNGGRGRWGNWNLSLWTPLNSEHTFL